MKRIRIYILSIMSVVTLCGLNLATAYADSGAGWISDAAPKPWVVIGNGQSYTKFNHLGLVTVVGRLQYETGKVGKVKSYWAEPKLVNGLVSGNGISSVVPGMNAYKVSKSYSVASRPRTINKTIPFSIHATKVGPAAIAMCNLRANSLRNQGKSNQQIFAQDHEVTFIAKLRYGVSANGAGSSNPIWEAWAPYIIKVRCAKWAGPKFPTARNFDTPLRVIKATMQKKIIVGLIGVCKVKLTTAISTNKANATVRFRYKSRSGKQSQVFTTKTIHNKIAVVTHTWNITNTPSVFDGTWIHMAGVSPNFKSNTVSAFAECKKASPSGLAPTPK